MTRNRSTRTSRTASNIRNVNDALLDNNSKKKARTQRQQFLRRYEMELGLQPGSQTRAGVVAEATCKFCARFGREENETQAPNDPYQIAGVLTKPKRKKTINPKVFQSFRRDNITTHMYQQHPSKWAEFQALPLDAAVRAAFFAPDVSIVPFFPTESAFDFRVPAGVMSALRTLFFEREENEIGLTNSDGFVELECGDCLITVSNRDQFEVIVRCVGSGVSHRGTTKLFQVFGQALSNMKLGRPNEQQVRYAIRYTAAINLTALKEILRRVWGFSVMVDGATHLSEGYLDVRITFGLRGITHNFHFLAIPTGDRAHTGETYATLVLGALRAVAGEQVLLKLIGIATDGAATMLGCNRGFVTRIKAACIALGGGTGIVANWCGSHQLNLVVNTMLGVFDEFVDFRSTLGYEIAFTHTHETVKKKVGSCPTYATTRWESIHDACVFLAIHYTDLLTLQLEKQRSQSCPQWWLCLFLLADMTRAIKLCFAKLQYKNVTIAEQYQALHGLARTMIKSF